MVRDSVRPWPSSCSWIVRTVGGCPRIPGGADSCGVGVAAACPGVSASPDSVIVLLLVRPACGDSIPLPDHRKLKNKMGTNMGQYNGQTKITRSKSADSSKSPDSSAAPGGGGGGPLRTFRAGTFACAGGLCADARPAGIVGAYHSHIESVKSFSQEVGTCACQRFGGRLAASQLSSWTKGRRPCSS